MADQPGLSFEIVDSHSLFRALCEAIADFNDDQLSTRKAVVCAMLAWHVADWIHAEHAELDISLQAFQRRVRAECPALSYMRDIATGTKHRATHWRPAVKATETHLGSFSRGFSRGFDVSCLQLVLDDGRIVYFDEQLVIVRDYWLRFFAEALGVES